MRHEVVVVPDPGSSGRPRAVRGRAIAATALAVGLTTAIAVRGSRGAVTVQLADAGPSAAQAQLWAWERAHGSNAAAAWSAAANASIAALFSHSAASAGAVLHLRASASEEAYRDMVIKTGRVFDASAAPNQRSPLTSKADASALNHFKWQVLKGIVDPSNPLEQDEADEEADVAKELQHAEAMRKAAMAVTEHGLTEADPASYPCAPPCELPEARTDAAQIQQSDNLGARGGAKHPSQASESITEAHPHGNLGGSRHAPVLGSVKASADSPSSPAAHKDAVTSSDKSSGEETVAAAHPPSAATAPSFSEGRRHHLHQRASHAHRPAGNAADRDGVAGFASLKEVALAHDSCHLYDHDFFCPECLTDGGLNDEAVRKFDGSVTCAGGVIMNGLGIGDRSHMVCYVRVCVCGCVGVYVWGLSHACEPRLATFPVSACKFAFQLGGGRG